MTRLPSRDVWKLIAPRLPDHQDLIELRATCHAMDDFVKSLQARWYRAHQWFCIQNGLASKCHAVKRSHPGEVSPECFRQQTHTYLQERQERFRLDSIREKIAAGELRKKDCRKTSHWRRKYPASENAIPLGKKFKPDKNVYYFWYLIERYRCKVADERSTLEYYEDILERRVRTYQDYKRGMVEAKERLKKGRADVDKLRKVLESKSNIFEGCRINAYKGFEKDGG